MSATSRLRKNVTAYRNRATYFPEPPMKTTRAIKYRCRDCGDEWLMWLQAGLAEGGEYHKPVPFAIGCKCGGVAYHVDWHEDIKLDLPIDIEEGMNYFANKPDRDCGVPVLR